jgi:cytochrome c553
MMVVALSAGACTQQPAQEAPAAETPAAAPAQSPVQRGELLTHTSACHDCHSPKIFGPNGPEADPKLLLSGAPAGAKLPPIPAGVIGPNGWGALASNDFTAWVGPWGVSYARNLTPDEATGIGSWTEEMFIKTIRDGKHQGEGRPLLPPMPWPEYRRMSDDDLKAIFAYLKSLPPVSNPVPEPIPPDQAGAK